MLLSSVIPKDSVVEEAGPYRAQAEGEKIQHVVIASCSSKKPDAVISAGLGWIQTGFSTSPKGNSTGRSG
ncbi:MAG: pyruvoyl-dependent arginine decarboxylase [Candidatus Aminicenantales bacterium]